MESYFAIDLIVDEDDIIKIIDPHGLSDAISFSERAGYSPRKSRIHRFMSLLNERAKNKKIIYLIANQKYHKLSSEVMDFFKSLPEGVAHLGWIKKEYEAEKLRRPDIMKQELLFFDQAARKVGAQFHPGFLVAYEKGLLMQEIFVRDMIQEAKIIPYDEVGLVLNWGSDSLQHPKTTVYWVGEMRDVPTLDSPQINYVFNAASKAVRMGLLRKFTDNLPGEVYIGMGRNSSEEVAEFVEKHGSFVSKPLCTHAGINVCFLSKRKALELVVLEKTLDSIRSETREKVLAQTAEGFTIEEDTFSGYFMSGEKKGLIPLSDLGSYALQERILARPFKSVKTGLNHTGTIRAQILCGEPIGIVHRFSTQEYKGRFQNIARKNLRTFWERADDKLEKRIVDFLDPLLTSVEEEAKKYDSSYFFNV